MVTYSPSYAVVADGLVARFWVFGMCNSVSNQDEKLDGVEPLAPF